MSKFLIPAAAAAVLVAGGLCAQTKYISPAQSAKASGNYNYLYWPFRPNSNSTYRYARYQEVMDLPASAKGKLSAIAWRGGLYHQTRGAPPAFSATMAVTVSTAANNAATMTKTFASNQGKDATLVVAKKIVKFAKYPLLPKFPQPFFFKVPFDANKILVFVGNKSLCLDITVTDNTLYNATTKTYSYFYPDSVYFRYGNSVTSHSGRPCFSSTTRTFLPWYGYTYANIRTGGTGMGNLQAYAYAYNGLSNGVAVHMLTLGKMPVGIPLGAGCSLYVNLGTIINMTPTVLSSYGSARFPAYVSGKPTTYIFDVKWQKSWAGTKMYGQSFAFDAKANKIGIVSTQLNTLELPAYYMPTGYPLSHVYEYQSGTRKYSYLRLGMGHVTELTFN